MNPVLELPMRENDAEAATVGDYLRALLEGVWVEGEGFSGKRPFGNGGWKREVYTALVDAKMVGGWIDEDGFLEGCDKKAADKIILETIRALGKEK